MNITIIGASAGVGLLTVKAALRNGHHVTALSRRLDTLPSDVNLTTVQGSATNIEDVKTAIQKADCVIVTIGTGASTKAGTLYSDAATVILKALKESKSSVPLIVLTGFGAGESAKYQSFFMKIIFSLLLKKVYVDKTKMEAIITHGYKNWEIVRPGRLIDSEDRKAYKVYDRLSSGVRVNSISRADVADFLIKQAESPAYIGKYPAITY